MDTGRPLSITRRRRAAAALAAATIGAAVAVPLAPIIARAAVSPAGTAVSATEGTATGSVETATFTATDAGPFTATIDWGDGVTDSATVNDLGGGNFDVTGSHTYADEGSFTVTTTVTDTNDNDVQPTTSTATVAEADSLTATAVPIGPTEGSNFSGTVATFSDTFSGNVAADFTATIDWGDGTLSAGTVSGGAGSYSVDGSHTYVDEGSFTVTTTLSDDAPGTASATSTGTATVAEGDGLSATGITVSALETQSFSGTVGTFSDTNAGNVASDFTATIDWGDGTLTPGTVSGSGTDYTVSGTHTYAEDGTYTLTFTVNDDAPGSATATATSTVNVGESGLSMTNAPFSVAEGSVFSGTVMTYSDFSSPDPASDYTATIDWGDGTLTPGTVSGSSGDALTVTGTHTYNDEGSFDVIVTVTEVDATGPSNTRSISFDSTATVTETDALSATPVTIAPAEGTVFNGTVATFSDANTGNVASDFTATIDWGDGTLTAGTISGGGGAYTVTGTHTYSDEGSLPLTVTVNDDSPGSATSTASGTANVAEADSTAVTVTHIAPVEGVNFSGAVATFSDSDTANVAGDFTATIAWGDGTFTAGVISGSAGSFTVSGTHTYAEEGSFPLSITVSDDSPGTSTATSSASISVSDGALSATPGSAFNGVEGMPAGGALASFTDADPNGVAADFTATVNWGDGQSSAGTVTANGGGGFTVNATHSYAHDGSDGVTVSIADAGGASATVSLTATIISGQGYWMVGRDGGVFAFGNAPFFGSAPPLQPGVLLTGIAATPHHAGYWLASSTGAVAAFGNARFLGDMHAVHLNKPIVGIAGTPDGDGYYLVASDGGIFTFGDAHFMGSTGGIVLNKPIVGIAVTPDGGGYYLVASDGGIFTFGDAHFHGSTGNIALNKPIVGMSLTPDGGGYYLDATDGGVFTFGDAHFHGSTGNIVLNKPMVGMATTPDGGGYWLVAADGGVFTFGDAVYLGGMGGVHLNAPISNVTAT
jgi:PKD repeat protein